MGVYGPPLVRLSLPVKNQTRVGLEPLGTFNAVIAAKTGQVLGRLGLLVQLEMPGRQEIGLDLINVAGN